MLATDIDDLIQASLPELGRMRLEDLASDQQFYEVHERILKRNKVILRTGPKIERNVMLDDLGTARNVGLYADDSYAKKDVLGKLSIDWAGTTTNWIADRRELAMNRHMDGQQVLDAFKVQREAAMLSAIMKFEANWWGGPSDPEDDETPLGVLHYLVPSATPGFNGGAPAGFTTVAGLSHANYKNWTDVYTAFTRDELVDTLVEAIERTGWQSPLDHEQYTSSRQQFCLYMNYATKRQLERIAEDQNDALGKDIYPMRIAGGGRGNLVIRGHEMRWAQHTAIEDATTYPILGVDWNTFKMYALQGEWNHDNPPIPVPGKHTVRAVHIDWTYNWLCLNRRRNFYIYKPAA